MNIHVAGARVDGSMNDRLDERAGTLTGPDVGSTTNEKNTVRRYSFTAFTVAGALCGSA